MFQFLAALLPYLQSAGSAVMSGLAGAGSAIGSGASSVGSGLANMFSAGGPMTAAETGKLATAMPSLSAAEIASLAKTTTAPGVFAKMFPGLAQVGRSAVAGDLPGMGGGIGKMAGSENLANMLTKPSWANLGKLGEGMGDKLALRMMLGEGQLTPQQAVGPGAIQAKQQKSAAMPEIEDPILKRMYQNLNPQRNQFASGVTPMKPWPQSPYPRKMSAV